MTRPNYDCRLPLWTEELPDPQLQEGQAELSARATLEEGQ